MAKQTNACVRSVLALDRCRTGRRSQIGFVGENKWGQVIHVGTKLVWASGGAVTGPAPTLLGGGSASRVASGASSPLGSARGRRRKRARGSPGPTRCLASSAATCTSPCYVKEAADAQRTLHYAALYGHEAVTRPLHAVRMRIGCRPVPVVRAHRHGRARGEVAPSLCAAPIWRRA